jgi:hypothetical protein
VHDLARAHYRTQFKLKCYESAGGAFQGLFDDLMEARYPGDYQKIRPSGPAGDRKNDGYLRSRKTLFQCYGPKEIRPHATAKKIADDFKGRIAARAITSLGSQFTLTSCQARDCQRGISGAFVGVFRSPLSRVSTLDLLGIS